MGKNLNVSVLKLECAAKDYLPTPFIFHSHTDQMYRYLPIPE